MGLSSPGVRRQEDFCFEMSVSSGHIQRQTVQAKGCSQNTEWGRERNWPRGAGAADMSFARRGGLSLLNRPFLMTPWPFHFVPRH